MNPAQHPELIQTGSAQPVIDPSPQEWQAHTLLAALSAGQVDVEDTAFDLHAQLEQLIQTWRPRAEAKRLQLMQDIDSSTPHWVRGSPGQLKHMLDALLSNAIKFTAEGAINLSVDTMGLNLQHEGEPTLLRFAIQDTGSGMSLQQRHLQGGLGLGLSLCKQLITLVDGEINIDSVPGEGSCVTLILSFHVCAPRGAAVTEVQAHTGNMTANGKLILVVDDNDTNLKVTVTILERLGYQTRTAVNGVEAVTAIQGKESFDLVLMDCHMPLVDGIQATQTVRAWEALTLRPPLPIIAVSASAFAEDRERCHNAGMNDFVPKPVTLASIRTALQKWFANDEPYAIHQNNIDLLACLPTTLFAHEQFSEMAELAGSKFAELLQRFLEDAERQVGNMRLAASLQDGEAVRRGAHKLRGSSGSLGAYALSALCERVETLGKQQHLQHIGVEIDAIAHCFQDSRVAIQIYLGQPSVPAASR